jgi:hypothetical protein
VILLPVPIRIQGVVSFTKTAAIQTLASQHGTSSLAAGFGTNRSLDARYLTREDNVSLLWMGEKPSLFHVILPPKGCSSSYYGKYFGLSCSAPRYHAIQGQCSKRISWKGLSLKTSLSLLQFNFLRSIRTREPAFSELGVEPAPMDRPGDQLIESRILTKITLTLKFYASVYKHFLFL